jgi:hypothetical protein
MISFSITMNGSVVCFWQWAVGTRGSEAMMDLERFEKVGLIDKYPRVLSRQTVCDAGGW